MDLLRKTQFDSKTKIWSGRKVKSIYNPDISLGQILYRTLQLNPSNVIQINHTENIQLTSDKVHKLSIRIALTLLEKNIENGDIVGIIAPNTSMVMPLCYGCLYIGAPIHPLDINFNKESIVNCWKNTRPKIIFSDGIMYDMVKEALEELHLNSPIYTLNNHLEGVLSIQEFLFNRGPHEQTFQPHDIENGDITAAIFCSSGTTGPPKAVCASHKSLLENTLRL